MVKSIIGRDLTEREHAMLRAVLIDMVRSFPFVEMIKHIYTCQKCGGETSPKIKAQRTRNNSEKSHKIVGKEMSPSLQQVDQMIEDLLKE